MNSDSRLRLFVAVELPPEARSALRQVTERLKASLAGPFRWVSADGVHLTLKFLGDVPSQRVKELGDALEQAVGDRKAFELRLSELGIFPGRRAPRVVWVGLAGDAEALKSLQQAVEEGLGKLGFLAEARGFTPHLTLARVNGRLKPDELARLHEALDQVEEPAGAIFRASMVALIQSTLTPSGAVYRRLREVPLRQG